MQPTRGIGGFLNNLRHFFDGRRGKAIQILPRSNRNESRFLNLKLVEIFLYDFTFLRKKVPTSFASFVGSVCSGRAVLSGCIHKELTTRNNLR